MLTSHPHPQQHNPSPRKHQTAKVDPRREDSTRLQTLSAGSRSIFVGDCNSNLSNDEAIRRIMELERKLEEKERDAALAANIGQELLKQVETLQRKSIYEESWGSHRDESNLLESLQRSNEELIERCQFQTEMINQLQGKVNEDADRLWDLELANQQLQESLEQAKLTIDRLKRGNLRSETGCPELAIATPSRTTQKHDRCCSPMPAKSVYDCCLQTEADSFAAESPEKKNLLKLELLMEELSSLKSHNATLLLEYENAINAIESMRASAPSTDAPREMVDNIICNSLEDEMRTAERQERRTHNIVSFTPPKTKTSVIILDSRIPRNLSRSTVMPPNFKDPISWGNSMIHSMIGMWCYKESNTAGLRYFWLQPWSRLLCWSKQRPSESKRKNLYRSTFIQSFSVDAEVILINSHKKSKSVCFRPAPEDKDIWLDSIQRTLEGDLFPLLTN